MLVFELSNSTIAFPFSYEAVDLIIPESLFTSWFTCSSHPAQVIPLIVNSTVCKFDLSTTITCFSVLGDRKSTRLNSSHVRISYAVFCLKKKISYFIDQVIWNNNHFAYSFVSRVVSHCS